MYLFTSLFLLLWVKYKLSRISFELTVWVAMFRGSGCAHRKNSFANVLEVSGM